MIGNFWGNSILYRDFYQFLYTKSKMLGSIEENSTRIYFTAAELKKQNAQKLYGKAVRKKAWASSPSRQFSLPLEKKQNISEYQKFSMSLNNQVDYQKQYATQRMMKSSYLLYKQKQKYRKCKTQTNQPILQQFVSTLKPKINRQQKNFSFGYDNCKYGANIISKSTVYAEKKGRKLTSQTPRDTPNYQVKQKDQILEIVRKKQLVHGCKQTFKFHLDKKFQIRLKNIKRKEKQAPEQKKWGPWLSSDNNSNFQSFMQQQNNFL